MAHPNPGAEQTQSHTQGQAPNQPPQAPAQQPPAGFPAGPPPGAMPPPGWQGPPPGAFGPGMGGPGAPTGPGGPAGPGAPTGPIPVPQQTAGSGTQMTPATWCRLVALLATPLGLSIPFDSSCMWVSMTAWAAFAMLAAIVQAVPLFKGAAGTSAKDWTVGAVGAGCLLLFWVLVALPSVASNTGFTLTVAAVAAAAGAAVAPGRRW